jgi:hypothetical protein
VTLGASLLLAGCFSVKTTSPVSGLRPISPPALIGQQVGPGASSSAPGTLIYETTDSSQPTLKWESFPGAADRNLDPDLSLARIANLGYDLRIWREENGWPAELVYEREGLPAPEHRVERPLAPAAKFCWSIRARFELDGRARVSRWGFAQFPSTAWYGTSREALAAGRVDQIPGPNYYRFQTPGL